MPDTLTIALNPQTGKKVAWNGKAWVPYTEPAPPSATNRFLTSAEGLPEGTTGSQVLSATKDELAHPGRTLYEATKNAAKGVALPYAGYSDANAIADARFRQPGIGNKVQGELETIENFIPYIGHGMVKATEQFGGGDYAGGFGTMVPVALQAALGAKGVPEIPEAYAANLQKFYRLWTETGKTFQEAYRQRYTKSVEDYKTELTQAKADHAQKVAEVGRDNAQLQNEYQLAVQKAKSDHAQRLSEARQTYQAKVDRFNNQTQEFVSGQANAKEKFDFEHQQGPTFERTAAMAKKLGENDLPKTFKSAKEGTDAQWNAFRVALGDRQVPQAPIYEAITNAEDNILAGSHEKIALFRDILKDAEDGNPLSGASVFRGAGREGRGGGIKIDEATLAPAAKQRFLASLSEEDRALVMGQGAEPVTSVPFDEARRTYTALNRAEQRALNSGHGEVARAIKSVKDVADNQITGVVPDNLKPRLDALKQNYSQYARDWYSNKSPIKKLMNAPNDQARINLVSGPNAEELVRAMDRYKAYGADPEIANRIRSLKQQVDSMKVSRKKPPEEITQAEVDLRKLPEAPTLKPEPEFKPPTPPQPYDPYRERMETLFDLFQAAANPKSTIRDIPVGYRMKLLAFRRLYAKMLADEARRRFIAEDRR
jgi:hypothetical protein